jgi:hypothetical protein
MPLCFLISGKVGFICCLLIFQIPRWVQYFRWGLPTLQSIDQSFCSPNISCRFCSAAYVYLMCLIVLRSSWPTSGYTYHVRLSLVQYQRSLRQRHALPIPLRLRWYDSHPQSKLSVNTLLSVQGCQDALLHCNMASNLFFRIVSIKCVTFVLSHHDSIKS